MKTVATHNGKFHTDDVFAIAILKLIYPKIRVIRTRDEKIYSKADARVDVGLKHDHKTKDYDHHQKGGAGESANGIPYASAGLIWKYYGMELAKSKSIFEYVDGKLMQHIDANDIGIRTFEAEKVEPYRIDDVVGRMNPDWMEDMNIADKRFNEAVKLAIGVLKNEIKEGRSREKAREYLLENIS